MRRKTKIKTLDPPGNLVAASSYQTVALWFKTTAAGVLFSYQDDAVSTGASTNKNYTPSLYVGTDGKLNGQFWYSGDDGSITSSAAVDDGKWHFVVLTSGGATQSMYLDGALVGSLSGAVAPIADGTAHEYLGAGYWGGNWPDEPDQGKDDNTPHTVIVDEMRIDDEPLPSTAKAAALPVPYDLHAEAFERHVDLKWESKDSDQLAYTVIYRSMDEGPFEAVGIQQPGLHRYADFVGGPNVQLTYKIAVVDKQYRPSGFSKPVSAETYPMSDDELLSMLQEECFRYYWERGSHPVSGMALESVPGDPRIVATGASGFGVMAIVVGMERDFINQPQGLERLTRIVGFLEKAQRYHGAWPHFMDGSTGRTMPVFGMFDDGGDLVETAFLMEGLLTAREYVQHRGNSGQALAARITRLWQTVEWDWYERQTGANALIWHWSPEWSWRTDHKLTGFNETMIAYLLAMASPTHSIPTDAYYAGWASQTAAAEQYRATWSGTTDGNLYANGNSYEGIKLNVGVGNGGPLFFTQYSFMGADPREIRDKYTDYFENNRNIALINYRYCQQNPGHFKGYGPGVWGLTASLDPYGYLAHAPNASRDNGTIAPTAALGSFPYTPDESMAALKYYYRTLGARLWGIYGPTDAFNMTENWFSPDYLALDQAPMVVMIENYRSGLIWKNFMANPEIAPMLARIGPQPAIASSTEHAGK